MLSKFMKFFHKGGNLNRDLRQFSDASAIPPRHLSEIKQVCYNLISYFFIYRLKLKN